MLHISILASQTGVLAALAAPQGHADIRAAGGDDVFVHHITNLAIVLSQFTQ
jgi:hypothetical protein